MKFEDIKMAIQLDTEKRNVFYESTLSEVFSKEKDVDDYELLVPAAKKVPFIKDLIDAGELIEDIWAFIRLFDTKDDRGTKTERSDELGQSQSHGSRSYDIQLDDYESRGFDPVQIIWGESKGFFFHMEMVVMVETK
ncbi:hypothetical protein RBH29_16215 [Herbivorax sp. ANBcel31]|uniref:hypothetical protein n=1 Tax=Herbivorax sp. ANBcel31 TaxID=3069754 RepID=UPI0027B65559|nr:hypothetical protein [Herbivorax sp. ANBcel31]MDQ2087975.1 hypothetical protein [Herbivorax sp. ANBcel31]